MFLDWLVSIIMVVFVLSMIVMWIVIWFFRIKCRKVTSCQNRKCLCWSMCNHNEEERRKDDLKLRLKAIAHSSGMSEEELNKYLKMVDEKRA